VSAGEGEGASLAALVAQDKAKRGGVARRFIDAVTAKIEHRRHLPAEAPIGVGIIRHGQFHDATSTGDASWLARDLAWQHCVIETPSQPRLPRSRGGPAALRRARVSRWRRAQG